MRRAKYHRQPAGKAEEKNGRQATHSSQAKGQGGTDSKPRDNMKIWLGYQTGSLRMMALELPRMMQEIVGKAGAARYRLQADG